MLDPEYQNPTNLPTMKILISLSAAALIGTVITSPAATIVFNFGLDADQEVPTPTLGGATPSGSATVTLDDVTGAVSISGSYTGLTSNTSGSHLHGLAAPGATAGVLIGFGNSGGTSGTFSGSGTLEAMEIEGMKNGLTYLNIHTTNNGSGEIRGQVVPEPSALALLPVALLAALGRRRK